MNRKRLMVLALIAFCCLGMVFAQGAKEALAAQGEKVVLTPNGYRIEKIAAAVAEEAKVAPIEAVKSYSLVGCDYNFSLKGDKLEITCIDLNVAETLVKVAPAYLEYYGLVVDAKAAAVAEAAKAFSEVAFTCEKAGTGVVVLAFEKNLTEAQFDKFVDEAAKLI